MTMSKLLERLRRKDSPVRSTELSKSAFEVYWSNEIKNARPPVSDREINAFDKMKEIAWKAWQAAKSDKPAPQNTMAQSIAAQIEGGGWPRTD